MCLAIVGRVIALMDGNRAVVNIGGNEKEINMALFPEAVIGDAVLVHAGFAIERISEREATEIQNAWREASRFGY